MHCIGNALGRWVAALAILGVAGPALAENRIALVIGNSKYETVTVLPNPANDAKAMTELLTSAGFEIVSAPDLTASELRRTLRDFAGRVSQKGADTVALVFYAGHGLQVDGENFLVPVDARIQRESDVPMEAVRLTDVMNTLASVPSRTRIVILDACRNNPFSEIKATTGRGLAIVDAPTGSIVSYSTAPGMEALDGTEANSPFTSALIEVAKEPGLPIEQALKRVRLAVHQKTSGQQTPWESSSLTSDFAFFGGAGALVQASADAIAATRRSGVGLARAQARSVQDWRAELQPQAPQEAYESVIREDGIEAYEAFIAIFGNTPMTAPMRALLDRRREMVAWYTAVTLNTPASFRSFLDRFPTSDLAATARRLQDRARTRSALASANAGPTGSDAPSPAPLSQVPQLAPPPAPPAPPVTRIVAVPPPACSCSEPSRAVPPPTRVFIPPPPAKKTKKEPPPKKQAKRHDPAPPPPRRRGGRPPTDAEIFGPRRSPGAEAVLPIAIGVGIGLAGGRRGGGGQPSRGPMPQSGHHR